MTTLFLDANVIFSAAYREKAGIAKFWKLKKVKLVTSNYALEEVRRNLPKSEQRQRLVSLIKPLEICTSFNDALIPKNIKLRDKDRPILAAAIGIKADYLITGDYRDFGVYFGKIISGVMVIPPAEYLEKFFSYPPQKG